jgi:hypothetical protein
MRSSGRPGIRTPTTCHGHSELSALRGASLAAFRRGDPYAGTTHLLVELLADPAGPAALLLRLIDVDPEAALVVAHRRLPGAA